MGIEGKVYDLGSGKKVVELTSGSMKGSARGRIGNLDRTAYVPSFEEKKTKPVGVIGMVVLFVLSSTVPWHNCIAPRGKRCDFYDGSSMKVTWIFSSLSVAYDLIDYIINWAFNSILYSNVVFLYRWRCRGWLLCLLENVNFCTTWYLVSAIRCAGR